MKVNMVNIFLTRKCNLKCSYCRISGNINYEDRPEEYPDEEYYLKNEKPYTYWVDVIKRFMEKDKDIFFLLYGGEPFLYHDIEKLLIEMGKIDCKYTIISNSTMELHTKIINILSNVYRITGKKINGFTASVDPGFWLHDHNKDEVKKSIDGFMLLKKLNMVDDVVAEITVSKDNLKFLINTVKILSYNGIYSSITVIDQAKNRYYDFSDVTATEQLIEKNHEVRQIFNYLKNSDLLIHMKNVLLDKIYDILPCNHDCNLDHDISLDSDGSTRLCLRIRGVDVQEYDYKILTNDELFNEYKMAILSDKNNLCKMCSWSGPLMSSECDPELIHNH